MSAWWLAAVPCLPWLSSPGTESAGHPACPGHENHWAVSSKCILLTPTPETPPQCSRGWKPLLQQPLLMILVCKGRRDISRHTRPGHQQRPPPWVSLTQPLVPAPLKAGSPPVTCVVTVVGTTLATSPAQPRGLSRHSHEEAPVREACLLRPSLALIPGTCRGAPVRGVGRGRWAAAVELGAMCPQFPQRRRCGRRCRDAGRAGGWTAPRAAPLQVWGRTPPPA